jgi:hypothetical protein
VGHGHPGLARERADLVVSLRDLLRLALLAALVYAAVVALTSLG